MKKIVQIIAFRGNSGKSGGYGGRDGVLNSNHQGTGRGKTAGYLGERVPQVPRGIPTCAVYVQIFWKYCFGMKILGYSNIMTHHFSKGRWSRLRRRQNSLWVDLQLNVQKNVLKLFFTASTIMLQSKLNFLIPNNRFMKSPTSFLNFIILPSYEVSYWVGCPDF